MAKLEYLFVHCTATPPKGVKQFTADTLVRMHTDPPPRGRGWRQVGYAALILHDGTVARFVKNDGDGFVDSSEVTNGARGFNSKSRHICYVGGLSSTLGAMDTLTDKQRSSLINEIEAVLVEAPDVKIIGHNQVANKSCPCFSVPSFLMKAYKNGEIHGLRAKNLALRDDFGHAERFARRES